jgi:hypothetical protein
MNKSLKITAVIAGLLVIMYLSSRLTGTTLEDITANRPVDHSKDKKDPKTNASEKHEKIKLPDPMGPATAPVKIKVYVTSDNTCDRTTLDGMKQMSTKFGDKLRIEFMDLLKKDVASEAQDAKISCKSGLTINGMSILRVPGRGVKGLVMFDGPIGEKNYNIDDVDAAVAYLLTKDKGGAGAGKAKSEKG